jgi:HPt (histidine-containing phosphotransfer) domain-containing protein
MHNIHINIEALGERTADDSELAIELLDLLMEQKEYYLNDINSAIYDDDQIRLASELHKFKSAVAVFGFDFLAGKIADVEKKALSFSSEIDYSIEINRIFISLNDHIVELEKILKK